ncbi:MAG: hypothetical protein ABI574_10050 [Burkholderiales bacterium]
MDQPTLRIALAFSPDDQAWIRLSGIKVPRFWEDHPVAPLVDDVLRIGGRQFVVQGRIWEHGDEGTVLRLVLSGAHAQSDTVFG